MSIKPVQVKIALSLERMHLESYREIHWCDWEDDKFLPYSLNSMIQMA